MLLPPLIRMNCLGENKKKLYLKKTLFKISVLAFLRQTTMSDSTFPPQKKGKKKIIYYGDARTPSLIFFPSLKEGFCAEKPQKGEGEGCVCVLESGGWGCQNQFLVVNFRGGGGGGHKMSTRVFRFFFFF